MNHAELEAGIQKLVAAITDDQGELRPISRIEFEIVGRQVRWSLWEGSTRLHTLTDRVDRTERSDGFLEATKMLLEMRAEDAA
jgi:hypothetical protein